MAKTKVEVVVDDLDGSPAAETIRLGLNGDWRELDLSKRNLNALSRAIEKYWKAGRPVRGRGGSTRQRRKTTAARSRSKGRDPKAIRAWALENGIEVPARGRIPGDVERRYNEAVKSS